MTYTCMLHIFAYIMNIYYIYLYIVENSGLPASIFCDEVNKLFHII